MLTVSSRPARGAAVRVAAHTGSAGQRWIFGSHQSLRPAADQKLCLNVPAAKYRSGARLQLWTCDGRASERFSTGAPSAHTQVFYLRPAKRTAYCLTSLDAPPDEAGARIGLERCAALTTQAFSKANLDGVVGSLSDAFGVQALHPASAGSGVTADGRPFANQLDQFWISRYTGASGASPVQLEPVEDTALCASLPSADSGGVPLDLAACNSSGSEQFSGIALFLNVNYTWSYLTTADGAYCVEAAATGSESARPVVLGSCAGNNRDFWLTSLDLTTSTSGQFQEIYAGTGADGLEFSMRVGGTGGPGSGVVLSSDDDAAGQVWTDLEPGQAKATGNPDGSITLRPLSDQSVCLAVPGGDYAAGVQLTVQTCDGQTDQEFLRTVLNGPENLVAAGDGALCVSVPAGVAAGNAVELEQCAQQGDQTWNTFFAWYGWAGVLASATEPGADPGDGLVITGASAAGGQVGALPLAGLTDSFTSAVWTYAASPSGEEFRSFDDPGLCLDAPAATAGTQLTAAPCDASSAQLFRFRGSDDGGVLWQLGTAALCVAVGPASGSAGLSLVLQACSASQADEAWNGPSYRL